jgi:hypothetical protein
MRAPCFTCRCDTLALAVPPGQPSARSLATSPSRHRRGEEGEGGYPCHDVRTRPSRARRLLLGLRLAACSPHSLFLAGIFRNHIQAGQRRTDQIGGIGYSG